MTPAVFQTLFLSPYCAEARAAFAAMTAPPNGALRAAYNTCFRSLISAAIWAKLDALSLLDVHDAQAARLNVRNPGTYNLSATNSPTFTALLGYTGNGSNAYLNTNFNPATATSPNFVQDSASAFVWSLKQAASTTDMAMGGTTSANLAIQPRYTDDKAYFALDPGTTYISNLIADGRGLFHINRSGASARQAYRNGASAGTDATASIAMASANLSVLRSDTFYYSGGVAMAGFGSSMSSQNAADLYTILSTFKSAAEAS